MGYLLLHCTVCKICLRRSSYRVASRRRDPASGRRSFPRRAGKVIIWRNASKDARWPKPRMRTDKTNARFRSSPPILVSGQNRAVGTPEREVGGVRITGSRHCSFTSRTVFPLSSSDRIALPRLRRQTQLCCSLQSADHGGMDRMVRCGEQPNAGHPRRPDDVHPPRRQRHH